MKKLESHKEIYTYQIDASSHVSNIVYIQWLEECRLQLLEEIDLPAHRMIESGVLPVLVETNIKYVKEMRMFDKAYVESSMIGRGFFIDFKQDIFDANGKKIVKAKVKCLFLDEDRNPIDIPDIVIPYLNEYY